MGLANNGWPCNMLSVLRRISRFVNIAWLNDSWNAVKDRINTWITLDQATWALWIWVAWRRVRVLPIVEDVVSHYLGHMDRNCEHCGACFLSWGSNHFFLYANLSLVIVVGMKSFSLFFCKTRHTICNLYWRWYFILQGVLAKYLNVQQCMCTFTFINVCCYTSQRPWTLCFQVLEEIEAPFWVGCFPMKKCLLFILNFISLIRAKHRGWEC